MFAEVIIGGLVLGCLYALMGLAMSFTYKATDLANFAQGEMAMVTTFVCFVVWKSVGWSFLAALGISLLSAMILGTALAGLLQVRNQRQSHLSALMITLGVQLLLFGLAGWKFGAEPVRFGLPLRSDRVWLEVMGAPLTELNAVSILLAISCMGLLYVLMQYTRFGLAMRASQQHPRAAQSSGIPYRWMQVAAFGISAVVGAIAGILVAPVSTLEPNMMWEPLLKGFAAAVLGGMKHLPGVVIGGLLLGTGENLVGVYLWVEGKSLMAFALIVLVLLFRPQGIFTRRNNLNW
ncbi:MAG: branched-chain amino acid ABC transporter permease [Bacteroidota bacterium]